MSIKETLQVPLFVELSRRETEVLICISKGLRVSDTARHLGLADSTVASYIKNLYRKLHITSRAEAAVEAVRRGLV
ncbi:MAG: LuxR C-terminal-related transcriptional regulator [Pseudomonadota bacterium]